MHLTEDWSMLCWQQECQDCLTTMRYAHLADDPVRRAAGENADRLSGFVSGGATAAPKLKLVGQPQKQKAARMSKRTRAKV
ncbi:MAG: hypothetical protein RID11_05335 [Roseovarius sp.]|jgi:hypothetical protein